MTELDVFAEYLSDICPHSQVAPGRGLRWLIIANQKAGGFTIKSRWRQHWKDLEMARRRAAGNPLREDASPLPINGTLAGGLIATTGPGHAGEITGELIAQAGKGEKGPFFLIITAGGDGTSLEVLTKLYYAPEEIRENCVVLRLPMGTGNDGACGSTLGEALSLLTEETRIARQRALRLLTSTPGKGPCLAFNILSVGLDAFVTHMTNRMKGKFPGDSYKLWVDIAALLYDRIYKVGPMDLKVLDDAGGEVSLREMVLLLAVGESGYRTYGSHKRILPDDRNVCLVRQMPLLRKLALKGLFSTGEHIHKPESVLFNARRVEFRGLYPILAQMDGETILLQPQDFPGIIELTEPVIPILRRIHP